MKHTASSIFAPGTVFSCCAARSICSAAAALLFVSATAHAAAEAGDSVELLRARQAPRGAMWLEEIGLERMSQRRGTPRAGRSIRDKPILLGGVEYPRGIGTRSISEFVIDLQGHATRFVSMVGIDDEVRSGVGSVAFEVWADDSKVAASGLMRAGDAPKLLSADLKGARVLTLLVDDGGDTSNDEVAWAGAMIELAPPPTAAAGIYTACGSPFGHRSPLYLS